MTPIRVRALYTRYPHWGRHAGFHQVCRHLRSTRIEVVLRSVRDGTPLDFVLRTLVPGREWSWYKSSDLAAELQVLLAAMSGRIDIVHYLDGEHTARFLPGWTKKRHGPRVRTIGTFHQTPELLPGLVSHRTVAALDLVLVMSPTQEGFFRELLPAERVRTFLHGVDTDFFKPGVKRDARQTFRCITVGHWLRDWNAIRRVVGILSTEKRFEFHFVTNRETGLEGCANVVTHRHVADDELRQLYQSADALLLPLTSSTANNCLLEGLASGLPVISTRMASVAAYVGEGPAYLIEDNAADVLARAIVTLREDDVRRVAMGRAARARAEELAWPRQAAVLADIYESLVFQ